MLKFTWQEKKLWRTSPAVLVVAISCWATSPSLFAQNDWQYPDPFFGAIQYQRQPGQRGVWSRGLPRPATDRDVPPEEPEAAAAERMFRERRPLGWRRWRRQQRSAHSWRPGP